MNEKILLIKIIKNKLPDIIFDIYGFNNIQPVWGNKFINEDYHNRKFALNLSRGEPIQMLF